MVKNISYADKLKNENLDKFVNIDEQRKILHEIRHLKLDIQQLERKREVQLSSLKKTSLDIKILKGKLLYWSDQIDGF